ncbi:MAG TPA: right-handed parallel beta-helix repeat-containing protein, partial [bacterium]|nr:right-handed parallel beta-helix repeat-containing protein [bacterium]
RNAVVFMLVLMVALGGAAGFLGEDRPGGPGLSQDERAQVLGVELRTIHIYAGQSIAAALANASAGDTYVVHTGSYPVVEVTSRKWTTPVRLTAAPGESVTIAGLRLTSVSNLEVRGTKITSNTVVNGGGLVHIAGNELAGVNILNKANGVTVADNKISAELDVKSGSHHVTVMGNTITGGFRNISLYGGMGAPATWIHDILLSKNVLVGATSDAVQITGARQVTIEKNIIRDPVDNANHNDGVQSTASDDLRIIGNLFTAPGAANGDQGIILSPNGQNQYMTVTDTLVANNLIHHWRGSGITVTNTTNTSIVNNTSYDNGEPGRAFPGLHVAAQAGALHNARVWNNALSSITYVSGSPRP